MAVLRNETETGITNPEQETTDVHFRFWYRGFRLGVECLLCSDRTNLEPKYRIVRSVLFQ